MSDRNFQLIPNPYIAGNPVKDKRMFFGREDDFEFIRERLTGDEKSGLVVLCGDRRSGKTSILYQIMEGRLGADFVPVLIDVQAITVKHDRELLLKIVNDVLDAIGDPDPSLKHRFETTSVENHLSAFNKFQDELPSLMGGRRVVVMFDEYELFEDHIRKGLLTTDVLRVLSHWIEHKDDAFIIFTGSNRVEEREVRYWQAFLGRSRFRRISFLTRRDTLRLVTEPLGRHVEYDSEALAWIYKMTAGQPFYTQLICQILVHHLNEAASNRVTVDRLEEVVEEIVYNTPPQMTFIWKKLPDLKKFALSIVAELNKAEERPYTGKEIHDFPNKRKLDWIVTPKVNEAIETLFLADLLEKDEKNRAFTFKMDLWRRWVTRMHSVHQVIDELTGDDRTPGDGIERRPREMARAWKTVLATVGAAIVGTLIWLVIPREPPPDLEVVSVDSTWVTITTQPEGATLYVRDDDGEIRRKTAQSYRVAAGMFPFRLERNGYVTIEDTLDLAADIPVDTTIVLDRRVGSINITSEPPKANIELDGVPTGFRTPHVFDGLWITREYRFTASLEKHSPRTISKRPVEADTVDLHFRLPRMTAALTIKAEPSDAIISFKGQKKSDVLFDAAVPWGDYRIQVERDGYYPKDTTVTVSGPGEFQFKLARLPKGELRIRIAGGLAKISINDRVVRNPGTGYSESYYPGPIGIIIVPEDKAFARIDTSVVIKSQEKTTLNLTLKRR